MRLVDVVFQTLSFACPTVTMVTVGERIFCKCGEKIHSDPHLKVLFVNLLKSPHDVF